MSAKIPAQRDFGYTLARAGRDATSVALTAALAAVSGPVGAGALGGVALKKLLQKEGDSHAKEALKSAAVGAVVIAASILGAGPSGGATLAGIPMGLTYLLTAPGKDVEADVRAASNAVVEQRYG